MLNQLRKDIRTGMSVLYDLNPLFVAINLGRNCASPNEPLLDEFELVRRESVTLRNS